MIPLKGGTKAWGDSDEQPMTGSSIPTDAATAREIVSHAVAAFQNVPGAVLKPSNDLVASTTPAASSDPTLLAWPSDKRMLMRSMGDYDFEGGFVGSLQLCYDLCTAEISLIG